jgi:hypothetical protein
MRRKIKENIILKELILQIEGLIDIEIGNYAYKKGLELYIEDYNYSSIDVYIKNENYTEDDYLMYGDREHIIHLHREDLLWFIMNFNKNKKDYLKLIDNYKINKEKEI